jgi:L-threonylcarbamoyladenylate synthase
MPASPLALALIKLSGVPLAAPSANASTRPSPTTAQHVLDDLDGRIEIIIDGGPCRVGVESTVVDGLCNPPVVLRPGGVSIQELQSCPGWEGVVKAYKDQSEEGKAAPRAPGMKYKHYSPKARVVLYESTFKGAADGVPDEDARAACAAEYPGTNGVEGPLANGHARRAKRIGIIRTRRWREKGGGLNCEHLAMIEASPLPSADDHHTVAGYDVQRGSLRGEDGQEAAEVLDLDLGRDAGRIAHGLFSALRELDRRGVDIIFVDGIADDNDIAAAVMNRLRKAASEIRA